MIVLTGYGQEADLFAGGEMTNFIRLADAETGDSVTVPVRESVFKEVLGLVLSRPHEQLTTYNGSDRQTVSPEPADVEAPDEF